MTYYSIRTYTATGTAQVLAAPPYISKAHITVYVDGVLTTSWSWASDTTISITATAGALVSIKRDSSPGTRLVDYQGAVPLTEADLDLDSLQAFYLAQEARDAYTGGGGLPSAPDSGGAGLPDQAGQTGKYLTTDGTSASWAAVPTSSQATVNTIAALRALDKTVSSKALVLGYYAPTDGGGGLYYLDTTDTTSTDNGGSIIVAADGGRWKLANTTVLSVLQFGAKTDGTDARVAIQAAIDALPATGGRLRIPTGTYTVGANGSTCLLITKPVIIEGDGFYSAIKPAASVGASVSTISIVPASGVNDPESSQLQLRNFHIGDPSTGTRKGNHGIYVDTQTAGSYLGAPKFENLFIGQSDSGGRAFCHLNNPTNNVNGGMYGMVIRGCQLRGGIYLDSTGDSLWIKENIISGTNTGIYASTVAGASHLVIEDNNITTTNGAIKIDRAARLRIQGNNIEQLTNGASNNSNSMINLNGANGTISQFWVTRNNLGAYTNTDVVYAIRCNATENGVVEDNSFLPATSSGYGLSILAGSRDVFVGHNQYGSGSNFRVSDGGVGTMGITKAVTYTDSWADYDAAFTGLQYVKDRDGFVQLWGTVKRPTAPSAGSAICNLPAAYRPAKSVLAPASTTSSVPTPTYGEVLVAAASGNVIWSAGAHEKFAINMRFRASGDAVTVSDV